MNKLLLTLALFIATIASAGIRLEITGNAKDLNLNDTLGAETFNSTMLFNAVEDMAKIKLKYAHAVYTLVKVDEHTATFTIGISRLNEEGEITSTHLSAVRTEWGKQSYLTIGNKNTGEKCTVFITAHQE